MAARWEGDFPSKPRRKTFVLLFDGTGNRFSGTDSDSNILKILRMLDRSDASQVHYYQPGIGTYVQSSTYSHTSVITRFNSWFQKARDSAIGSSFAEHVMGGYKFLMQHYDQGDDLYIFGFSRGAYIARFLAEMLDYVGLLESGNEEMARFAWKAFSSWQRRLDSTDEEKEQKRKMFRYLKAFRDTFSRPVRRIRFLGLFDTVNSVPAFESAWLQRSKFPYTANSSALVIRHAVGIDERRAKFRQDLISQQKPEQEHHYRDPKAVAAAKKVEKKAKGTFGELKINPRKEDVPEEPMGRYRRPSQIRRPDRDRSISPAPSKIAEEPGDGHSMTASSASFAQIRASGNRPEDDDDDADEALPQDTKEMWFPGCHADIGGGWPLEKGESIALSHGPLCWIVREAQRAGLRFDSTKLEEMNCGGNMGYDDDENAGEEPAFPFPHEYDETMIPGVQVTGPSSPSPERERDPEKERRRSSHQAAKARRAAERKSKRENFHGKLHKAATEGVIHDCLLFNNGIPPMSVVSWKVMEYMPFRRMDLQSDGSWKSISWPLPKGEVRDIPEDALIHTSALRRMQADEKYRPGNLIVGGGGRGVRIAPKKLGMGEWDVVGDKGDPVGECMVRRMKKKQEEKEEGPAATKEENGATKA